MAVCTLSNKADAREGEKQTQQRVKIHLDSQVHLQPALLKDGEQAVTTILAGIHIQLDWAGQSRLAPKVAATCAGESTDQDLFVEIVPHAPASFSSVALAMAMPYANSGVRIVIFYDRVEPLLRGHHAPQAKILGYVLAHEIGHVLQGVARHSESGIMRARWLENDFKQMGMGTLTFTNDDVKLIRRSLRTAGASAGCSGDAGSSPTAAKNSPAA